MRDRTEAAIRVAPEAAASAEDTAAGVAGAAAAKFVDNSAADRPFSAYDSETCSIARTLALIGDRWTLLVLRDVTNGVRRFDDLAGHLGVARNVLSRRLADLVDHGLVKRVAYRADGARERYEYRLTDAGRDLVPILLAFMGWGDKHLAGAAGAPALPTHADCGEPVHVSIVCAAGHDLGQRPRLNLGPGPGSRVREPAGA